MLDSIFRGVFDSDSAAPIYIRQADKAFITLEGENFLTNGGTFIGTGSSVMAQTFSDNTQGIIAVSLGGPLMPERKWSADTAIASPWALPVENLKPIDTETPG